LYKKWASYLSIGLLALPLVARSETTTGSASDLDNSLQGELSTVCASLPSSLDAPAQSLLVQFYQQLGEPTLWHDETRLQALRGQLQQLADDGLDPGDYPLPTQGEPACRELLTSHSFLRALQHLHFGRLDPTQREPLWRPADQPGIDPQLALLSIAPFAVDDPANAFDLARPALPAYQSLRQAYAKLRLADLPSWQPIAAGPLLKPERSDPRVPQLYQRLHEAGYLQVVPDPVGERYDSTLLTAVERFQSEHGLQADGIIGPATLTALNVSPLQQRSQLRDNLERLRWLHRDMPSDGLLVNIAAAELRLYKAGELVWQTRTQVGRPERRSPQLLSQVSRITLNPTWSVPPTILREDVIPRMARNPGYLASQRLRVVDRSGHAVDPSTIDWAGARQHGFPYMIVQQSGADGSLGRIKFSLSNPYAIYLHDTNARSLFRRAERALSSGCVRVEKPTELARLLLDDPVNWSAEALEAALDSGRTRTVAVGREVTVLLHYSTAWLDGDGRLQLRNDIYDHDRGILAALAAPRTALPR